MNIATVFSGIGAAEHALERMKIKHNILFACDNGDIDILSKKIDIDLETILKEICEIKSKVKEFGTSKNFDKKDFFKRIKSIEEQEQNILEDLNSINYEKFNKKFNFVNEKINSISIDNEKFYKKYNKIFDSLKESDNEKFNLIRKFKILDKILKNIEKNKNIFSDETNNEIIQIIEYLDEINLKDVVKRIKHISEELSMLNEILNTLKIKDKISTLNSFDEKNKYINSLYESKEKQNKVRISYLNNYKISEKDFHWNVSFLDGKQYENKVDLFVGGSPCQSFSLVGKQRGLEDTRGTLFYEYARLIKEIKPKVFIYENVKALLTNDKGRTWETMKEVFKELGYNWKYKILNSKNYGVPQNRERLFVVGIREDIKIQKEFKFPEPFKLEKVMQDFLLDNVSGKYYLGKKGVEFVTKEKNINKRYTQIDGEIQLCQKKNQQFNWHGDFVFVEENRKKVIKDLEKYFLSEKVKKYVMASGTKGFYAKPKIDLEIARPLLTTMHKMHRAGVDNYVTTDGRIRKLAPRECLRLMGFCDSFKICVSDTAMYQQAGNSIVVDVLINIIQKILESYPELNK